jgi:quinol monooxygenase YgiN
MTIDRGLLAILEAQTGKGDELAAFLQQARELAAAEQGTVTWYAFRLSETTYGIFDTFAGEDAREAHLTGQIPADLGQIGPEILSTDPDIRQVDVVAGSSSILSLSRARQRPAGRPHATGAGAHRPGGRTARAPSDAHVLPCAGLSTDPDLAATVRCHCGGRSPSHRRPRPLARGRAGPVWRGCARRGS